MHCKRRKSDACAVNCPTITFEIEARTVLFNSYQSWWDPPIVSVRRRWRAGWYRCGLVVEMRRSDSLGNTIDISIDSVDSRSIWTWEKQKQISQTESKTNVWNLRFIIVTIVKDELSLKKLRLRVRWSNRKIQPNEILIWQELRPLMYGRRLTNQTVRHQDSGLKANRRGLERATVLFARAGRAPTGPENLCHILPLLAWAGKINSARQWEDDSRGKDQ